MTLSGCALGMFTVDRRDRLGTYLHYAIRRFYAQMSRQDNTVTWWDPDLASSRLNYSQCHDAREIYPRLCNLGIIWGIWCLLSISSRRFIATPLLLGTMPFSIVQLISWVPQGSPPSRPGLECAMILDASWFHALRARIIVAGSYG